MLEYVKPGEDAEGLRPGDLLFIRKHDLVSRIILLGESIRGRKGRFSHVACVDRDLSAGRGTNVALIEALVHGVAVSTLDKYRYDEYHVWRANKILNEWDRVQCTEFWRSCVGQKYGKSVIVGIALRYLTPGRGLWFGLNGTEICSGMAAQGEVKGWANFSVNPASITPDELAEYCDNH